MKAVYKELPTINFLGVGIHALKYEDMFDAVDRWLEDKIGSFIPTLALSLVLAWISLAVYYTYQEFGIGFIHGIIAFVVLLIVFFVTNYAWSRGGK